MHQGMGGLTLRFTRLDSRSKALVDKAATFRERRRPSMRPDAEPSPPAPPALEDTPSPVPSQPEPPTPLDLESTHAEAPAAKRSELPPTVSAKATPAPPGRDELLERLRKRSKALEATAVQRILEQRRRQA
jgi:hypothetical protein